MEKKYNQVKNEMKSKDLIFNELLNNNDINNNERDEKKEEMESTNDNYNNNSTGFECIHNLVYTPKNKMKMIDNNTYIYFKIIIK